MIAVPRETGNGCLDTFRRWNGVALAPRSSRAPDSPVLTGEPPRSPKLPLFDVYTARNGYLFTDRIQFMDTDRQIDWFAIPDRFQAWQAKPTWRKLLWLVSRSVTMVVLYVAFAAAFLWYNAPEIVEGVGSGDESVWALLGLVASRPELLGLLLILFVAVPAATLLPHKPSWR